MGSADQGGDPGPMHWEQGVLATGPQGSLHCDHVRKIQFASPPSENACRLESLVVLWHSDENGYALQPRWVGTSLSALREAWTCKLLGSQNEPKSRNGKTFPSEQKPGSESISGGIQSCISWHSQPL